MRQMPQIVREPKEIDGESRIVSPVAYATNPI